jgi:tripeptidyl-peptidase-1
VIQPTTNFGRFRRAKSTIIWSDDEPASKELANAQPIVDPISGVTVDASCNTTITLSCLQQIYNFVGYKPSSKNNSIGITGYLDEYANLQDLQSFYADQRPDALGSSFKFVSVKGVSPVRGHSSSLLTSAPSKEDSTIKIRPWLVGRLA